MPYVNKPRPYKKEYEEYQGTPEQIKKRATRNAARAKLMKEGKVSKGDGKEETRVHDADFVLELYAAGAVPIRSSNKDERVEPSV